MEDFIIKEDLSIGADGDFVVEDATGQHIEHIMVSHKGAYKEFPLLGVGITNYLHANNAVNRLRLEAEIEKQLGYDNFNIRTLDINDLQNMTIDGNY